MGLEVGKEQKTNCSALHGSNLVLPLVVWFVSRWKQGVSSGCALVLCGLWASKAQLLCRDCFMKGAVGLEWSCWMMVSSGRKQDDRSNWGTNGFLGQHCCYLPVSCFWRSSLLLLSCIYAQEHFSMWVPYVGCPLKSSLSPLLLFLKAFFKENACLNCTIEVEEVPRTTMQRWWFTKKKVWA